MIYICSIHIYLFFSLSLLDATPAAFSEDSQEAMNNSNSKEPSKNITNAEVAAKNLPDLTGENQSHRK